MIGTLAGGGSTDRPLMRAGVKWRKFRSRGQKYPIVRGVAQAHMFILMEVVDINMLVKAQRFRVMHHQEQR